MARLKCPCCGKPYNGKKCDECLYEPFGDVEVHNHAHGTYGIPATQTWKSVIQTEAEERKPVVVSAPQQTSHRKTTHAGKRLLPIFLIPIICIVLSLLFELVVGIFVLSDTLDGFFTEEVPSPEVPSERFTLYQDDDITIFTPWRPNTPIETDLTVFVENNSVQDVVIHSSMAAVNGIMAEDVLFYCEAETGTIGVGTLWIDPGDLDITTIGELVLHLEILDADTYQYINSGILLTLYSGQIAETVYPAAEGTTLIDQNGFLLKYQGWQVNEYGEMEFFFYGQNSTSHALYVSSDEIVADGISTEEYLWTEFLPGAQHWFSITIADLSMLESKDPADIGTLSFSLDISDYYNWASFNMTQAVEFTCNP